MFFQINVTPKEKKSRKCTEGQQDEDGKQPELYTLVLAPFQPQTRVKLDTTVYNSIQCRLNVNNPSNRNLKVTVSKVPPTERSIELTAMELSVEAESSADLVITWTPQESGSWRDTLQLTDSRRVKYDVALITTAISTKKPGTKVKSRVLGPSNSNKTSNPTTRKFLPSAPREPKKNATTCGLAPSNVPNKRQKLNAQPENKENLTKSGWTYETTNICPKTNFSRSPPVHDFSALMNSTKFNLTPLKNNSRPEEQQQQPEIKITKPFDVKFSPLETGIISPQASNPSILRRETYTTVRYLKIQTTTSTTFNEDDENFDDSLSPQPDVQSIPKIITEPAKIDAAPSDFSVLINDMNFLTPTSCINSTRVVKFSPNDCSTATRTSKSIANTSYQEPSSFIFPSNDTFNVSETNPTNNSPANGTYELITSPTRSKDTIKPTRLTKSFGTTSPTLSDKSGPVTTSLTCFNRLSTRFDYEKPSTSHCKTPKLTKYDDASVKDVLEADLWVKPDIPQTAFSPTSLRGRCSSLEKISEQRISTSKRYHATWTKTLPSTREEKSTKSRRIDSTPPKKNFSTNKIGSMRRVSPTKNSKIRKEKSFLEPSSSLRKKVQLNCSIKHGQVSCSNVRIANLSLANLKKTTNTQNNSSNTKNEYQKINTKLYDSHDFITQYCNPDPFGATMTQDPFLTSTIYHDDRWMYDQEIKFKKWLNALLTAPENLNADVDTIRVDVGKVWQSCRAREDVGLAETRETVSARYHTNTHLDNLRKVAFSMYRREEIANVLSKTMLCVNRGTLVIRQDRDLHRDIGLQKEILELFLSYNPLWLRIGLETVYGETIPLNSNNDLIGLTRFILTRFFADPFIVKTHSHPNTTQKLPTFVSNMNNFILKKFLIIIYFLDYSKTNKLIGHDPCLFHKLAAHKDSRSIILTFSREVLSGVGDVTKLLRSHGYVVTHKQTYLDEYDYAVQTLSTDLRDGVRLCRVMELITGDRNLTRRCRVPAISRLQKIHNVDVAISALLRCGYTLTGDIDAKSVADGHREKTLSLLWQIIYKYQAPRFEKAAKTLQKWWRGKLWYVRVRFYLRNRRSKAVATIQRAWRCRRAREILEKLREERSRLWAEKERAIRVIQIRWRERRRMMKDRERFLLRKEAVGRIQRWWRRRRDTEKYVDELWKKRRACVIIQQHWRAFVEARKMRKRYFDIVLATVKLQNYWRSTRERNQCRRNYLAVKKATVTIQSRWRALKSMRKDRESFNRRLNSVGIIQSWWRRILILKRDRNDYLLKKHSTMIIENWWIDRRMIVVEKEKFEKLRKNAIVIQRIWRRYSQTKSYVMRYEQRKNACRIINRWWKTVIITKRYNLQRKSCIILQRWWRGRISMKSAVISFAKIREAATVVQKNWRMKKTREKYILTRNKIVRLQFWYRNIRISRTIRRDYVKIREAALILQKWWRSLKMTRNRQSEFLYYRKIVIAIQIKWRANKRTKSERKIYLAKKEAITRIQSSWRMIKARRNYARLIARHRAAVLLQKRWRETSTTKKLRENYLKLRSSTVVIQKRFRALTIGKRERTNYSRIKRAAIIIQKNWRTHRASINYEKLKRATLILQSRWRARKNCISCRNNFLTLKRAIVVVQRRYRAMIIRRRVRNDYLKLLRVVRNVQMRFRANSSMKKDKKQFLEYRRASIVFQCNWRMILEKRRYERMIRAVLTIQWKWKARIVARRVRKDYEIFRKNVIAVQRRFRAKIAGKMVRNEYVRAREMIIRIQNVWRAKLENRKRVKASEKIENWWKSILEMRKCKRKYVCQKNAILIVQKRFRAYKIGVETRREYVRSIAAISRIQRGWRAWIRRKRREEWLRDCGKAVRIVEIWWLGILERKRIREAELAVIRREIAAATRIQTAWRGHSVRRRQCATMKELRQRSKKAAEAALPTATVAYQMQESMDKLLGCDTIGQLSMCLATLDTLTRLSLNGSVAFCKRNLVNTIYDTMSKSNRSLPWLDVCQKCASILITLTKMPETKNYVYRVEHIETLARLMTITVDRHVNLFLHLATLLWLLAENPNYAEAITSCHRSTWLLSSLSTSMNKTKNKPTASNLNKSRCREQNPQLPSTKPDWGLKQKRPRLFTNVQHAITSLMKRLTIEPTT